MSLHLRSADIHLERQPGPDQLRAGGPDPPVAGEEEAGGMPQMSECSRQGAGDVRQPARLGERDSLRGNAYDVHAGDPWPCMDHTTSVPIRRSTGADHGPTHTPTAPGGTSGPGEAMWARPD